MKIRPDDVFICTYPKVGTTWTQEMVWQILNGFDVETGKMPLLARSPFLELSMMAAKFPPIPGRDESVKLILHPDVQIFEDF